MNRTCVLGTFLIAACCGFSLGQSPDDLAFIIKSQPVIHSHESVSAPVPLKSESDLKWAAMTLIRIYQRYISSQDGPVCNFSVSCSRYGVDAIQKYGIIHGVMMASDRIQRCNGFGRATYPQDPKTFLAVDLPLEMYYLGKVLQ
jgi:putative membrane protein insertion efficiency factor